MAYNQNVGTPRFYVDYLLWLKTLGLEYILPTTSAEFDDATLRETISLNPAKQITLYTDAITSQEYMELIAPPAIAHPTISEQNTRYFAVLGHNIKSASSSINVFQTGAINVVNADTGGEVNGFSIATNYSELTYEDGGEANAPYGVYRVYYAIGTNNLKIGCYSVGNFYQMPHSPDLSLTLGYETGTKTIETRGGASLSNTMWRPPMWGDLGAWELSDPDSPTPNQTLAHSSRRTWNLSFSFLDKTNTFPKYNALNRLIDQNEELPDNETLLTSDDFFSQVWNKVGTALPFIFQPDKDVSEFAICKFTNNFSFQQTAPGLYSVKMKIREVW